MTSRKKTSALWNHFEEDSKTKKGKCLYCSEHIAFTAGSLGNLTRHLKRKHPTISTADERQEPVVVRVEEEQESQPQSASQPVSVVAIQRKVPQLSATQLKMDGFAVRPMSSNKKTQIDDQLVTMICKEFHPLSLVNDTEFRKFVGLLNPSYTLPSRKTLSESLLTQRYLKITEQVRHEIAKAEAVCITTDGWTSDTNESFIAITAHFIDPESSTMCTNLLCCIKYEARHTSENLCEFIKIELRKWKIDNKVGVVVSDNAQNILSAVEKEWRSIRCFAHTLNLAVQRGLQPISEQISKVKKIAEYFHRSTQALTKLKAIQKQLNLPELKLKQDVCTSWNSTYDMLERALRIREAIITTLALIRPDLIMTPEDWSVIEKAIPVLKIFYEITVEISTEKSVSLSKVIVYCRLIKKEIGRSQQQAEAEQDYVIGEVLKSIEKYLSEKMGYIENNQLYAESTILDPRFKGKGFRDEHFYQKHLASLKQKVGALRLPSIPAPTPVVLDAMPSTSSSTTTTPSIWNDFDEEVSKLIPENNTAAGIVEVDKCIQEPLIHRTEDPLLWWHHRKSVYPLLYKYVLKRLNIVATSVPCERVFSKAGLTLSKRRQRLKADKVAMMLFIGSNKK